MTTTAPCDWPLPPAADPGEACAPSPLDKLSEGERERVTRMAVELLWAWTGHKYGLCPVTVKPCREPLPSQSPTFWGSRAPGALWLPVLVNGEWFNIRCGVCLGDVCGCTPDALTSLVLPPPVGGVVEAWVDGVHLTEDQLRLDNGVLYRVDGGAWPITNNVDGDPTVAGSGSWSVTYLRGTPVPVGGQIAAQRLAEELAKAVCADSSCELPSRVQSITRQGVSMELMQTEFSELKEGQTGIWIIDSWVASVKATVTPRPSVLSPDVPRGLGAGTYFGMGRGRTW